MRRSLIISISVVVVGALALTVLPYIQMEYASSAHYTQLDKREYEFYTPELIKEMPRISDNYEFNYSNVSGPQAFVFSIQFNGTTDMSKIREYLESRGYEKQTQCQTEAECWRSHLSKDVVSLYNLPKLNTVNVEIYRRDNAE